MTAAPRMLALVTDAFGGAGGIAQYNRDLLSAWTASGAVSEIQVLPRHTTGPTSVPTGIVQDRAHAGRLPYALNALSVALGRRFELVFCGHLYMAPLAAVVARLNGAKLIVQTHGVEAWPRPTGDRRAGLEAADLVLSVSRHTRARVLDWAAIPPERIGVLPNTVGEDFAPGDGSALRMSWGLAGRRVLLTVGRMDSRERYKGQDRVITAIPALVEQGLDVVYVVLGDGDDRPRLESLARDMGVAERVRFMGAVAGDVLVDAYRMADLFVMPSTGEGFGIAYLEAMACGTPALGLAAAGASDALADGELGLVATESDLAECIARSLVQSHRDAKSLSGAVRRRFGRPTFTAHADATLRLLTAA